MRAELRRFEMRMRLIAAGKSCSLVRYSSWMMKSLIVVLTTRRFDSIVFAIGYCLLSW